MTPLPPQQGSASPGGLDEALARFAEEVAVAPEPLPPEPPPRTRPPTERPRRAGEVAVAFAVGVLVCVAFDAEGLLAWAQRLDVGPVQTALLAAARPVTEALAQAGLAAPRRHLASAGDAVAALLGAQEDPVLAGGWVPAESTVAAALPPLVPLPSEPPPSEPLPSEPLPPEPLPSEPLPSEPLPPELPAVEPLPDEPRPGDAAAPGEAAEIPDAAAPDAGAESTPAPVEVADARRGVLLVGDSMIAGSLGTTLHAVLGRGGRWQVAHAYQLGTGLARPDVYDWMKVVPPLLERDRPRFVVVSFGGNDGTNLREGGEAVDFGTARWRQVYSARVEAMMRALAGEDTRVLWLGLPPMRDARLARRATYLNAVFAQAARRVPRVEFLQLDMLVSTGQGQYATFLTGRDGKLVRYRLDDGVHLAPAASRAIARWVIDWLRERSR